MDDQLKAIIDRAIADGVSDEDIDLLVNEHKTRQAAPVETAADRRARVLSGADLNLDTGPEQMQYAMDNPLETAAMIATPAVLGAAGKALPFLKAPIARAALSPMGQGVIGGVGGYVTGGAPGAVMGAIGGATGGILGKGRIHQWLSKHGMAKPDAVAQGMSQAGRASPEAFADDSFNAILAKVKAKNPAAWADDFVEPVVAPKPPVVTQTTPTPARAFENELGKRIDWRTTDAVPINAMKSAMGKGGSIIEAGESIPGLADRMAALLKQNTPTALQEAQTLAKALRQRGHITAKGMK